MSDGQEMTLAEFLLARYAEEESIARAVGVADWERHNAAEQEALWNRQPHEVMCGWRLEESLDDACTCGYPARVLAECAAKRRIIELHRLDTAVNDHCWTCEAPHPCVTVRLLVAPYKDHPDFSPEWLVG